MCLIGGDPNRRRVRLPVALAVWGWVFVGWVIAQLPDHLRPLRRLPERRGPRLQWTWWQHAMASVTAVLRVGLMVTGVVTAQRRRLAPRASARSGTPPDQDVERIFKSRSARRTTTTLETSRRVGARHQHRGADCRHLPHHRSRSTRPGGRYPDSDDNTQLVLVKIPVWWLHQGPSVKISLPNPSQIKGDIRSACSSIVLARIRREEPEEPEVIHPHH